MWGIQSIAADSIVLRIVAKTRTSAVDAVARELRARVLKVLAETGVQLPSANQIVIGSVDPGGAAREADDA